MSARGRAVGRLVLVLGAAVAGRAGAAPGDWKSCQNEGCRSEPPRAPVAK